MKICSRINWCHIAKHKIEAELGKKITDNEWIMKTFFPKMKWCQKTKTICQNHKKSKIQEENTMNAKILNTILKSLVLYRNTIELPAETIVLEQTIELPGSIDLIGSQKVLYEKENMDSSG